MQGATARWKVAIVDDHERSRAALRAAIWAAGGEVAVEVTRRADALAAVTRVTPDLAVIAVGLGDGDGVDAAAEIIEKARCPVVLFTSRTSDDLVKRAREAGVIAFLLKPLRAAEVAPTFEIAIARFRENEKLARALEERKVIERAKGVLMSRLGVSEEEAFRRLRRAAMDGRRPMVEVAQALLVSESVAQTETGR
jgi:response regulator NasT